MLKKIAQEIASAEMHRGKSAEVHFQVLINAERLENVDPERFCDEVGIERSWALEYRKMLKLSRLLRERGYSIVKK
jgi:hypothetical protein